MTDPIHISSIVVTANPARFDEVTPAIGNIAIAEIATTDPSGKIIVTLETPDESEMINTLTDIQLLPGVVSAALVYHQKTSEAGTPVASPIERSPA